MEAPLTQNETSMKERKKKCVSLEEELLSHSQEEFRKELSGKDEKARNRLSDLRGCREEKARNQHEKELEGMLQGHEKLWKQLRNQEEIQHLHAEVRQLQVRQHLLEKIKQKPERLFFSFHQIISAQKKQEEGEETDHLNVFQNNGLHTFKSEGRTDGDAQKTPECFL